MINRIPYTVYRIPYVVVLLIVAILVVQSPSRILKSANAASIDIPLRVCVLKDAQSLNLTIKGHYQIITLRTNELIKTGDNLYEAEVIPSKSGLVIKGQSFNIYGVKIVPRKDATIYIGKRSFRGSLDIIRTENEKLLAINHVDLEDYLKGVLYHEVSHWWPMEVLKAQAIAARTYALYQKSKSIDKDFDLTNDIYSQVYGGKISERIRTNQAVNLTRSKVLTFDNQIFPAYYHATCGGYTEDASFLWDINLPPLKGTRCNFCRHSPHYRWEYKLSIPEIERKLNLAGYKIEDLKAIRPEGTTSSGMVKELKFISLDKELIIPAKDFRLIIGPNLIRSTNFKLDKKGKYFSFYGYGWGHGAGMCQWGAFFLSLRRYKAEHILKLYYPGAKVTTRY